MLLTEYDIVWMRTAKMTEISRLVADRTNQVPWTDVMVMEAGYEVSMTARS